MKITSMLRLLTKSATSLKRPSSCAYFAQPRRSLPRSSKNPATDMPSSVCSARRRASSWLADVHPTMIGAARLRGVHQQRARDRLQRQRQDHQQHRRHQHPGHDHAARVLFGELGDVAERQQAATSTAQRQQQVGRQLEAPRNHLRSGIARRQHGEREAWPRESTAPGMAGRTRRRTSAQRIEHHAGQNRGQRIHQPQQYRRRQRRATLEDDRLADLVLVLVFGAANSSRRFPPGHAAE